VLLYFSVSNSVTADAAAGYRDSIKVSCFVKSLLPVEFPNGVVVDSHYSIGYQIKSYL
jgi:hypothetical protein